MKTYRVYLGRFSPFHYGHQKTVDKVIEKYGHGSLLLIIGSSNSYTDRTPYTFEERKKMIKILYPQVKIIAMDDIKPKLEHSDGTTDNVWLKHLKDLEKEMGAKFIFYGGSTEDLEVLAHAFETEVIVDRSKKSELSATNVRQALAFGKLEKVKNMVSPKIFSLVVDGYNKFHAKRN